MVFLRLVSGGGVEFGGELAEVGDLVGGEADLDFAEAEDDGLGRGGFEDGGGVDAEADGLVDVIGLGLGGEGGLALGGVVELDDGCVDLELARRVGGGERAGGFAFDDELAVERGFAVGGGARLAGKLRGEFEDDGEDGGVGERARRGPRVLELDGGFGAVFVGVVGGGDGGNGARGGLGIVELE